MSNQVISFDGVGVAENKEFVRVWPGYRKLSFGKCEAITSTQKGTPGLRFELNSSDGGTFNADFWLSGGALSRLQYLHKALFGDVLTKSATPTELAEYFNKKINTKTIYQFVVGGKKTGNNTYCELPYTDFIVPAGTEYEERDFNDKETEKYIRVSAEQTAVNGTSNAVLSVADVIIS